MDHFTKIADHGQPQPPATATVWAICPSRSDNHGAIRHLVIVSVTFALLLLAYRLAPMTARADDEQQTVPDATIYLPLVMTEMTTEGKDVAWRMGFSLTSASLSRYPEAAQLGAGWYLDWLVRVTPERPNNIEYAQMIRVHQKLACGAWYHADDKVCPYATPLDYVYQPDQATVVAAAQTNPGSLWFIGNEMDRIDWAYCAEWETPTHCKTIAYNGQDEILPETYAVAYHDLYHLIKTADPTARIAIGGMIQATPLRLQYLTRIWDSYQTTYSTTMPVDVWNVHNFIIREKAKDWGAEIPPGINAQEGAYIGPNSTHIDMTIFDQQIRAFRQWMKERGQQEKALVVSEYGVLYPNGLMGLPDHPSYVHTFMVNTFDYFYQTKDCTLGMADDDCRLVQQWNWYSLDDTWGNFNPYSRLFDPNTTNITATGEQFRRYIAEAP